MTSDNVPATVQDWLRLKDRALAAAVEGISIAAAQQPARPLTVGVGCTVEILNHRKDGTPFWNRLSIKPVRDHRGEVTHFIGVQSDVTDRRVAEDGLRAANAQMRRSPTSPACSCPRPEAGPVTPLPIPATWPLR